MHTFLGLMVVLGIALASCVPLAFGQSKAVGCSADEIEVYRDRFMIKCKDRKEYSACIGASGEQMKRDLSRSCGATFKGCFENRNVDISIGVAACLAGTLACSTTGQPACVALCNVTLTAQEWNAYHSCTVDVSPCYESALEHDKDRKERCKE